MHAACGALARTCATAGFAAAAAAAVSVVVTVEDPAWPVVVTVVVTVDIVGEKGEVVQGLCKAGCGLTATALGAALRLLPYRTARSHMPCHCDAAASHSSHAICDPPPLDLRPPSCSLSAHMHMRIAPPSLTHARTAMRAQSPVLLHSGAIAVRPYESTASKPYSTPYAVRVTQHTDASRVLTRVFSPTGLATAPRRGIGDHVTPSHSRIQNPVL
jgi:hypothetical protein